MNLATIGKSAVARYDYRHAALDDLQYNSVGFHVEANRVKFCAFVRGHLILEGATWKAVSELSQMHNARLGDSLRNVSN